MALVAVRLTLDRLVLVIRLIKPLMVATERHLIPNKEGMAVLEILRQPLARVAVAVEGLTLQLAQVVMLLQQEI